MGKPIRRGSRPGIATSRLRVLSSTTGRRPGGRLRGRAAGLARRHATRDPARPSGGLGRVADVRLRCLAGVGSGVAGAEDRERRAGSASLARVAGHRSGRAGLLLRLRRHRDRLVPGAGDHLGALSGTRTLVSLRNSPCAHRAPGRGRHEATPVVVAFQHRHGFGGDLRRSPHSIPARITAFAPRRAGTRARFASGGRSPPPAAPQGPPGRIPPEATALAPGHGRPGRAPAGSPAPRS